MVDALAVGAPIEPLARYFEYWLLRLQGVYPSITVCTGCSASLQDGAVMPPREHVFICRLRSIQRRHAGVGRGHALSERIRDGRPGTPRRAAARHGLRATARDGAPAPHQPASREGAQVRAGIARNTTSPLSLRMVTLQQLIFKLSEFWSSHGCLLQQPLDVEMGAGTMHPETFLRVLGPAHWNVAYVQPSRRPADGRFGENPNRLFKHHQFQVILKPAPDEVQQLYLQSVEACGIDLRAHDVRFEEDNWESPTLGAWGIGWQVLFDGQEITQFTYFQQAGGIDLSPISVELTYGIERLGMALQDVDNVFDLEWATGRDISRRPASRRGGAVQVRVRTGRHAGRGAERAAPELFDQYYGLAQTLLKSGLVLPAHEYCLKCSHMFNLLDAGGGIGVTERMAYILRVRQLAVAIAKAWVGEEQRRRNNTDIQRHGQRVTD